MAKKSEKTKPVRRAKKAGRKKEEEGGVRMGYRQKIREKKMAEANKPKGCARLAVMVLFIPIVAVTAFWFLMS